jgi:CubicO group peptidase (beta-lactamase class C family)
MKKASLVIALLLVLFCGGQDKIKQIDSVLTASYKEQKLNGNVLIAEKGAIIYQKSFGKANEATNKDLDAESVFELASVSKQFTAMGIMLLKKQGKLSYDDSLRKFIPELPYYNITIRQLLHHTSGLPDYMDLFMKNWDSTKIATNQDMIDQLSKYKPAVLFTPGEKWEYSNTGYALLATIIEKVSGKSFGDYLDKYIFKPLEMKRTMVYRRRFEKKEVDNYAYGYVFDKMKNKFVLPDSLAETARMVYSLDGIVGDGTVNSTSNDLLKWDRALYTEQLVPKEMLAEAFTPGILNDGKNTTYGFGWILTDMKGIGKVVSHTGGWPGYSTVIERHLDTDKTIIFLRNHDIPVMVLQKIRNILYGIKEEPKNEIVVSTEILKQYIGEYELAPGFTITISVEPDKLFAQATGQERFQLFAEKENLFFLKVVEAKIQFVKDEKGAVNKLILFQAGQEVPGIKIK